MLLWWSKYFHNACKLFLFIFAGEDGITGEQFGKDTSKRPHINRDSIAHSQNNFRRAVKAGLDICVHLFVLEATASKINNLDLRVHWVSQQDIFGLEIAMYDALAFQQTKGAKHLFREAPDKRKREALEFIGFYKFVQVHAEEFSGDAQMATEVKTLREVDHAVFVFWVLVLC
jgi:hypothetical protein